MDFARVAKDAELKNNSSTEDQEAEGSGVGPGGNRRRRDVNYHHDQFHSRVVSYKKLEEYYLNWIPINTRIILFGLQVHTFCVTSNRLDKL